MRTDVTELTESLLEVLPQKAKRPSPAVPDYDERPTRGGRVEQHVVTTIQTESPSPRAGHLSSVAHLNRNNQSDVTVNNNSNLGHNATTHFHRIESAPKSINDSYAGQMTFDDEFDSLMSSSHVDYDHSSADEEDDLVKRSLMKTSGNRRANIEDIEEENITTSYVEPGAAVYRTEVQPLSPSHYDKLPQRPTRTGKIKCLSCYLCIIQNKIKLRRD